MTAILLLFVAVGCALVSAQDCSNLDSDVLILGGGFAGVAAAKTLHEGGLTDFILLEARNSLGGRVRRASFAGAEIGVGAQWIQGLNPENPDVHPFGTLIEDCDLDGFYSNYDNITVYSQNGTIVTDRYFMRSNSFSSAIETAEQLSILYKANDTDDVSLREGLIRGGWSPETPVDDFTEWFSVDFCLAEPPDVSSLQYFPDPTYSDFGGEDFFVTDARGYEWLVQCIANGFLEASDERLHLTSRVREVQWGDECVCAITEEGGETDTYCAQYGIVTFSFGVLQANDVQFVPDLPSTKMGIINRGRMANYQQVLAQYDSVFWEPNLEYIGYAHEQRGYYSIFQPLDQILSGNPKVLIVPLTDELGKQAARAFESEDVILMETVKENLTLALRSIYGPTVPDPMDILVQDWWNDPLYRGTYAAVPIGVSQEERDTVAEPSGKLYITGDGVSKYVGYTHGSYLAGISTAEAILDAEQSAAAAITPTLIGTALMIGLSIFL